MILDTNFIVFEICDLLAFSLNLSLKAIKSG